MRATRAFLALVAAAASLGSVVAYAATRSEGPKTHGRPHRHHQGRGPQARRPPQPRLIEVPASRTVGAGAQFRFHVAPRRRTQSTPVLGPAGPPAGQRDFECRLDRGGWAGCASPHRLSGLDPGGHSFAVRALDRHQRPGPATYYSWSQLIPQEVEIEPEIGSLEDLLPGGPAQQLPVRITNPNPAPIEVTRLTVAIAPDPPGCPGDPNFSLTAAGISSTAPLHVPAGGSVGLPDANVSAPTISLRELPRSQNACQGVEVPLVFSGEARG